jgi:hypothetical protein
VNKCEIICFSYDLILVNKIYIVQKLSRMPRNRRPQAAYIPRMAACVVSPSHDRA